MLAQVYKDKNGGAEPPSTLLRAIMMNTADDLGNAGPDYKTGYGRPNMRRAYNVINNAQYLTDSISNGDTNSHTLAVPANTKQVRVMLDLAGRRRVGGRQSRHREQPEPAPEGSPGDHQLQSLGARSHRESCRILTCRRPGRWITGTPSSR